MKAALVSMVIPSTDSGPCNVENVEKLSLFDYRDLNSERLGTFDST